MRPVCRPLLPSKLRTLGRLQLMMAPWRPLCDDAVERAPVATSSEQQLHVAGADMRP